MSDRFAATGWLAWLGAGTLLVVTTRNPFYLTIVLLSAAAVFLTRPRRSTTASAWTTVVKIGLGIALVNVAFNLLTVHVGDHPFGALPQWLPIFGGILTFNALFYGLDTSLAIAALLLLAATFNATVDRLELVRLLPPSLSGAGVAAVVGLSFFPQTLHTLGEVRQAQAARGFRVRRPRDLRVIIVPVLHLSLEHAFDLAETLECRGFGARRSLGAPAWLVPTGMTSLIAGAALVGMGTLWVGVPAALAGVVLLAKALGPSWWGRRHDDPDSAEPSQANRLLLAASLTSAVLSLIGLVSAPAVLSWSPYPFLGWPILMPLPSIAASLLAAPLAIEAVG